MSTTFVPHDDSIVRKPDRTETSFIETIVGRHGDLRASVPTGSSAVHAEQPQGSA